MTCKIDITMASVLPYYVLVVYNGYAPPFGVDGIAGKPL